MFTQRDVVTGQLISKLNNLEQVNGGINVIDYDPSQYEIITPLDLNTLELKYGAELNQATGEFSIAVSGSTAQFYFPSNTDLNTEVVFLESPKDQIPERGKMLIDLSNLSETDLFGIVFKPTLLPIFDTAMLTYMRQVFPYEPNTTRYVDSVSLIIHKQGQDYYIKERAETGMDVKQGTVILPDAPILQLSFMSALDHLYDMGLTLEQLEQIPEMAEQLEIIKSSVAVRVDNFSDDITNHTYVLPSKSPLTTVINHFCLFLTPNHENISPPATLTLDPTSSITVTYDDLAKVQNAIPDEAKDGDYLHLLGTARLFDKTVAQDKFIRLYDNKTKFILIGG